MNKTDIKTGETIERDAYFEYFHSDQEVNLESTDVDGLYDKINVKKTVVLNTLVTMTLASDVENSKN